MRKTRSTRNSKNKFHWNKVQRFSIRKFSFGVASCMIGAQFVLSGLPNTVEAAFKQLNGEDGIVSLYSNSGETPESANGIEIGSKVNVDKEIGIDVDWSEYTRENPIVKVTYTYNGGADGSSVTGFGGHRPRFWFTTPIGLKEPKEITLKKNDGRPVYVMESWNRNKKFGSLSNSINSRFQTEDDINRAYTTPDFHGNDTKWESYNETTGEPYREYSGSFANKFWYHIGDRVSDNASEQALFEKFRTDTKTIYVDWERGGIERATITAVYEVADPTFGNDRRTLEFGAGFRVGIARMMQHYKTVLAPVPSLYKLNEIFEPDVPSRIAVTNPKSLTTEEKNTIKAKILEANKNNVTTVHRTAKNKLVENLFSDEETSIEIGADGKATIRYADNTIDEIPGTSLVYERPQINNNETTEGKIGDYKYLKNPFEVDDINNLKDTDVESAKSKFYTVNKMTIGKNVFDEDVITAVGDPSKTSEDFKNKRFEIDKSTGIGSFFSGSTPIGVNIPKDHLFKQKPQKTFNIDEARQEAEKAIDNLTYLSPNEKQNFKTELASKTTQDDLNTVVNNAIAKNSSNEKALEAKKRDAKEAINNNPYLTNAQKKELTDKVSAVVMTDPTEGTATPIEHTKGLIDKILDEALDKTKEKAKAIIDEIDKKDGKAGYLTDPTVDAYKERIKNAPSQAEITKIIGEAQAQVSKKAHDAEKAKTDALKDEYKKKIDQVPGLTDAQKDEYKKQIDAATTRDQLEAIVKDAEVKAYRDTAKAKIDALEHLNAAQKAELKTQVDAAGSKAEVDNIVSIAQGLDSKMDSLQKLVAEAEKVKASDKYTNPNVPQDKKTAFDTAKDAASKVADKTTAEPENAAGTSEVATLIDNLAKAIKGLTGEDVAVPVSKDALKAELDLNTDDAVKKSPAYAKETDAAKKKAYDDALANAQKVYDKQDATQTDVDNALETLKQARLALSGKAEDFTLGVKEGTAKISVVPKAGAALSDADKETVKAKVTANGNDLDDTYSVEYGAIAEKGDKKVVPVTVTHDGITRTVDVPVEGTDAAKSPLNDPEKVKVNNVNNLSEDEKAAVKAAVKKANTNLTDNQISVDNTGKVTVTYSDKSQNELPASKTVEAKTEAEKALDAAKEKAKADLAAAANKEKEEIEADKNLTDQQKADKKAEVDNVKKAQETNIDKATTPEDVTKATEAGKKAIDAVHQTELDKAKEKAKADLTEAANKEKAEIEADKNLTDQQKADKKAEVDKVKKAQEANIDNATTPEEVAKATEDGKKAIDAVHQTELDKAKEKAKADLTDAANKEKAEIEADKNLTEQQKADKKAEVDKVKKAQEANIDNATTPEEVAKATEDGKKAIDAVHQTELDKAKEKAKADLTDAANKEKAEIEADKNLTDQQKADKKAEVDKVKKAQEANIDKAGTTDEVAKATEAGKKAIDAVHQTELDKAKEKAKADLTEAANKEKAEIDADKNLTDQQKADKKAEVDKVKKAQEANIDKAQTTDEVAKATEAGKKAIDAVHKTELDKAKEKAKADLTEAANKEKAEIEADKNLTDQQKADKKAEVDKVKKAQEANIDKAQTTDEVAKATEAGKKAIDAVHQTELDKAKEKAKADLTEAANKEKAEIEADKNLTDQQKADKKAEVDKVKKEQEANIDKAQTTDEVAKATEDGKKAIDKVHQTDLEKAKDKAKADLTKAAEEEKKEIDADNGLTKSEKEALKQKVDEVKKAQEANIDKANTPEEVASATTNGKQAIAGVHTPTDIKEYSKELNKPENKVKVTDTNHLTDEEKSKVKEEVVKANPGLSKDDITVDDKGNVTTPKGFLLPKDVITQALNKPATPVVVADPNHLTDEEKEAVKKAVADANPGLNKDDITVDDKGNVTTKNGDKLLAKDVVTPALKKPTTPVVVENPASLTDKEKENIKDAVVAENPGLNKGDVKVDNQGNVETPKGNLPKEDVVTTPLNKPNKLVEVENPNSLTVKEKEAVKEAVVNANPGLDKKDIKVDDQGNVTTPKGNLSAKDVVTSTLKKPTTPVEVVNPAKLTDQEKAKVVEEIIKNNPGLTDKDIKVDDQGNVETPKGNLPSEDVVTPALKKPTKPVEVKDPNNLTDKEKEDVKKAVIEANKDANGQPTLNGDQITVNNDGSVTTPKGNLQSGDVVTPALKKPTKPVEVKDPNNLTDKEKEDVKKAVIEANKDANGQPTLNGDQVTVNNDGSVTTPKGNLPSEDVVTPALKKPTTPVEVKDPNNLTDKEKEDVKKAVIEANKDANGQPTLSGDQVTVNNDGSVITPKGNLPAKDVVKTKVETAKGAALKFDIPELSYQDAVVAGVVAVEKGKELTDKDILTQLALGEGAVTAKVISKPTTTETGTKEAEVEVTLADGRKVTVKVPVVVYEGERPEVNDLAKAKEDAKKQVEEAAKTKIAEINNNKELTAEQKQKAEDAINKAKEAADKAIEEATSAGTAKAIGDEAAKNIAEFKPEQDSVKPVDPSKLDEEKAKAIAEIEQVAKDQTDAIKNNAGLTQEQKDKAIKEIEDLKAKAIENVRKATTKEEVANVVKEVETAIKNVDPQPIPTPQPQPQPQPGNNGGNGSNQNAQVNSDAVEYAKQAAKNILEEAARAKKAQLEEAGLSDAEKEELFAKVDAEKQAALDEIAKAKDVDTVKQLVTKAVAKIKAIQPARNTQDNQDSQDAQNAQNAQNTQDAQNHSNSNPTSLDAANVRGQELPATGTGSEFVVFNAAAISILTGLGLAIPSKKKETEK